MAKQLLSKSLYFIFGLVLVGLCLRPVFASPRKDAYPFSSYPMFAGKRKRPEFAVAQMQSLDKSWQSVPPFYLGTDEVMQAAATIRKASRSRRRARALCRKIAQAIAQGGLSSSYQAVRIMKLTYDPLTYFSEAAKPLHEKRVMSCRVPGSVKK